jgi:extradiol dioxygenase family protein
MNERTNERMNAATNVRGERSEILPTGRDSEAIHLERPDWESLSERKGMISYEHERAYKYRFYGHVGELRTFAFVALETRCTGCD